MATRKPLVIGSSGLPEQLQSGDTLGITTESGQYSAVAGATVVPGCPVYVSGANAFNKARANALATSRVLGLAQAGIASAATGVIQQNGTLVLTTTQWDAITGQTGGLTSGSYYWLDPATAGMMTTTPPSTVGQTNVLIGLAMSTTDFLISPEPPILL
jgi:hypothetical protein